MGMSGNKSYAASASVQEILGILANAEKLFWSNLSAIARRGRVVQVRDAAGSLALIQLYQTSLGKSGAEGAVMVANLLGKRSRILFYSIFADTHDRCKCKRYSSTRDAGGHTK